MFLLFAFASSIGIKDPDSHDHTVCKRVVRGLKKEVKFTDNIDILNQRLSKLCKILPSYQKQICNAIVQDKLNKTVEMLKSEKPIDLVCNALGYGRVGDIFGDKTIPTSHCIEIVDKIKSENSTNNEPKLLRRIRSNICSDYLDNERACQFIFRFVKRAISQNDFSDKSSSEICHILEQKRLIRLE